MCVIDVVKKLIIKFSFLLNFGIYWVEVLIFYILVIGLMREDFIIDF